MERISNDSEKQKVTDERDIKRLTDEMTRLKSELLTSRSQASGVENVYCEQIE
jgi:predicted  nucleic acid-binding Zn-ribbon protein